MTELLSFENLVAFATLTGMEIVLGIDNVVFISIVTGRLPAAEQPKARRIGLALAMITRIALLMTLSLIMRLTTPWFTLFDKGFSGRDLILLLGGVFLIGKSAHEIHHNTEGPKGPDAAPASKTCSYNAIIAQILILDVVFSLDSVITAVGMTDQIPIMIAAIVVSVGVMLAFSGLLARLVENHPSIKMLALSFLLLIGVMLTADGLGKHVDRGYVYFAMGFSLMVEIFNLRAGARRRRAAA